MKTVFVHPERCLGCKQCETACAVAHSTTQNIFLAVFEKPLPKPRIHAESGLYLNTSFPNKCRHCNPAPCQMACPTGAVYRPNDMPQVVVVDERKCIACGMCAMLCPFGVITYYPSAVVPEKVQVAIKCDDCLTRQRQNLLPACVQACKSGALEFGEINAMVKSARARIAGLVSVTGEGIDLEMAEVPANLTSWRDWGASVTHLNADGTKGA